MKNIFIFLFVLLPSVLTWSDERTENLDFIIVLDKSISMEEPIQEVKQFLENNLIDRDLIFGDTVTLFTFWGEASKIFQSDISTFADRENLRTTINNIQGDGRYTDIGNALDLLASEIDLLPSTDHLKYFLLFTDGKQEAPPESPYYAEDGTFNHQFLENAKIIRRQNWMIQVLGIGPFSQATELAEELDGTVSIIQDPSELGDNLMELDVVLRWTGSPVLSYQDNQYQLLLPFEANNVGVEIKLNLQGITLEDSENSLSIYDGPVDTFTIAESRLYQWELFLEETKIPSKFPENGQLRFSWGEGLPIGGPQGPLILSNIPRAESNESMLGEVQFLGLPAPVFWILVTIIGSALLIFLVLTLLKKIKRPYTGDEEENKGPKSEPGKDI